jgi:hypothetical protein
MTLLIEVLTILITTIRDVLPIVVIIFGFQFFVLRRAVANPRRVALGFFYVLVGLALFLLGLEKALFPLGRLMASQLTTPTFIDLHALVPGEFHWINYYWVYLFAFAMGWSTTIAEPALMAVAIKANEVSGGSIGVQGLRHSVALGAAVGVSLGCYRIVAGDPIHYYIIAAYIIVIIQTQFAPRIIIALAYDSGGVTTSTVTVPIVAALGLGLSESVPGRNPLLDGFGLIAFTCLFPVMSVMAYAQLAEFIKLRRSRSGEGG